VVFDLALCSTRPRFARRSGCLGSVLMGGGESELSGAREGGREGEEREEKRKEKKASLTESRLDRLGAVFFTTTFPLEGFLSLVSAFLNFLREDGSERRETGRERELTFVARRVFVSFVFLLRRSRNSSRSSEYPSSEDECFWVERRGSVSSFSSPSSRPNQVERANTHRLLPSSLSIS